MSAGRRDRPQTALQWIGIEAMTEEQDRAHTEA